MSLSSKQPSAGWAQGRPLHMHTMGPGHLPAAALSTVWTVLPFFHLMSVFSPPSFILSLTPFPFFTCQCSPSVQISWLQSSSIHLADPSYGVTPSLWHIIRVCVCVCVCVRKREREMLSHVLFATPWTVARQAPLSMEFTRQEYRSR